MGQPGQRFILIVL